MVSGGGTKWNMDNQRKRSNQEGKGKQKSKKGEGKEGQAGMVVEREERQGCSVKVETQICGTRSQKRTRVGES